MGEIQRERNLEGYWDISEQERALKPPRDDPRWPAKCGRCDYRFTDQDEFQLFAHHIYVDDAGNEYFLHGAPPGAMWDATWYGEGMKGSDGLSLIVVCPDGKHWAIDGSASNCTMPGDRSHRCWVRHGTPPNITVDKNGHACAAGAGSIDTGTYHGFLRGGEFI